jgi:hypothetical protein
MSGEQLPYILGWLLKAALVMTGAAISLFGLWAGSPIILILFGCFTGLAIEPPVDGEHSYAGLFRR